MGFRTQEGIQEVTKIVPFCENSRIEERGDTSTGKRIQCYAKEHPLQINYFLKYYKTYSRTLQAPHPKETISIAGWHGGDRNSRASAP